MRLACHDQRCDRYDGRMGCAAHASAGHLSIGSGCALPSTGMLLQVDGSKHDWLEGRGPWLKMHAAIDDATNAVTWAVFRQEGDTPPATLYCCTTSAKPRACPGPVR